jgi:hypothetical protein
MLLYFCRPRSVFLKHLLGCAGARLLVIWDGSPIHRRAAVKEFLASKAGRGVCFARDIERFLNDEPVTAGPLTAAYRLRKFVRRNRGRVIAASLVLVALVGGVIGTTAGLFEARRQAEIARGKEQEANEAKK